MDDKEKQKFKEHYSTLPDEDLLELSYDGEKGLVEGAYKLLLEEIKKRSLDINWEKKEKLNEERMKVKNERKAELDAYASNGSRFLGGLIDISLSTSFAFLCFKFLRIYILPYQSEFNAFFYISRYMSEFISICFYIFLYYFLFELLYQRTPGKFFTKTKVLGLNNMMPTGKQILIRSLTRFVPFDSWFSGYEESKWIGRHDRWSHTKVVRGDYPEAITTSVPNQKIS